MGFLGPTLLAGAAFVAIPIVLHLVMRREPQRLEFPALRFVRKRQSTNQHRLQLRHWLLLVLRCAVIALLAFALARPVLRGSGLLGGGKNVGLAAAIVFDTSPRMGYRQNNATRLDEGKELALWLLEQLPAESEVAVVDPRRPRRAKLGDRDAAMLRAERLRVSAATPSLSEAVIEAVSLVNQKPDYRREVYIFSDLAAVAWDDASLGTLRQAIDAAEGVQLYIVDVGAENPTNRGLGETELSAEHLATGESLTLRTPLVQTAGQNSPSVVELWVAGESGEMQKRGEKSVPVGSNSKSVEFSLAGLEAGVHQGYLRLTGDDPLPIDNTRYFTVEVKNPARILLVGQSADDTRLLSEALAPSELSEIVAPRFACESISLAQLGRTELATWDAVCLVDPPPPSPDTWKKLGDFAQSGGGVAIFLGHNAVGQLDAFNSAAARALLPGQLKFVSNNPRYVQPFGYQHPVLRDLADFGDATPWSNFPVFKCWEFGTLEASATIIASYADGSPAVIDSVVGAGHVLTMTTTVADRASDDPWNLLPTNPDPWPYLALVEGMADYLVGTDTRSLNTSAGRVVALPIPRRSDLATYVLEPPVGEPLPQSLSPGQQEIVVTSTDEVGNYRVASGGERSRLDRGFSVNADGSVGRLDRQKFETITAALGKENVRLATSRSQLTSKIDLGRVGRELYPWIISLLAVALAGEQWLADRFYARREKAAKT